MLGRLRFAVCVRVPSPEDGDRGVAPPGSCGAQGDGPPPGIVLWRVWACVQAHLPSLGVGPGAHDSGGVSLGCLSANGANAQRTNAQGSCGDR